ncbi:MAG: GNAT family N-acetyltransferase [Sarcina sp.]
MENLIIRPIVLDDAQAICNIRKMDKVITNIMASKSESPQTIRFRINAMSEGESWYVAEFEDKVIGMVALNQYPYPKKRHVGTIAIMVDENYHSKGVGKKLMERIIEIADENVMIKRLELTVFEGNENAINLYKKFGFKIEGKREMSINIDDKYISEVFMGRLRSE